ncbi:MAG: hypothetical protein K0U12_00685 [Gammaproteobacteria bacterium]|nr:hypothetical protein [Gammaproteobacteria bacterium]
MKRSGSRLTRDLIPKSQKVDTASAEEYKALKPQAHLFENADVLFELRRLLMLLKTDQFRESPHSVTPTTLSANEKNTVDKLLGNLDRLDAIVIKIKKLESRLSELESQIINLIYCENSYPYNGHRYASTLFRSEYNPYTPLFNETRTIEKNILVRKIDLTTIAVDFLSQLKQIKTENISSKLIQHAEKVDSFIGRLQLWIEALINKVEQILNIKPNKPSASTQKPQPPSEEAPSCELTTMSAG